jgi:hypothetical protein
MVDLYSDVVRPERVNKDGLRMSIKKELLSQLSVQQLKELAGKKGVSFSKNDKQKQYYAEWSEKDQMIDMMNDNNDITVKEIEDHIKSYKT